MKPFIIIFALFSATVHLPGAVSQWPGVNSRAPHMFGADGVSVILSGGEIRQEDEKKKSKKKKNDGEKKGKDKKQDSESGAATIDQELIGSNLTRAEMESLVSLHRKIRADVGVEQLIWSKQIAAFAQQWADHLVADKCDLDHRPYSGQWRQLYGENLFMGTARTYGAADAVKAWESEKSLYKGQPYSNATANAGHYTQLVWKKSKQFGCGKAQCRNRAIVVCNYDPPGNHPGEKPY
jgi:hypothetical protein